MALKTFYTDASEIPENLTDFYAETADGGYALNVVDIDNHPAVRGLVTANKTNKAKAQERLAELEQLRAIASKLPEDFDPDEWERLKSGGNTDEQITTLKEQQTKAIAALRQQLSAENEAVKAQLNERDNFIDGLTRKTALDAALDEVGFDAAHKPMLTKFLADQIKVRREEDGSRVAYADTDLGDLSTLDFVKDFAAKQGKMYLARPSGPSASGSDRPTSRMAGDIGGEKSDRVKAIGGMFPELPKK